MSDAAKSRSARRAIANAADPGLPPVQRLVLDARRPRRIDDPALVLEVVTGHLDLFAISTVEGRAVGGRTHLFRVAAGGLVLGLPPIVAGGNADEIVVVAVGGQNTEVLVHNRGQVHDIAALDGWIAALSAAVSVPSAEAISHDLAHEGGVDLAAGEHLSVRAAGVSWLRLKRGSVRLLGAAPEIGPGEILPFGAGSWIEAADAASLEIVSEEFLGAAEVWHAIDRFHEVSAGLLTHRLAEAATAEAQRLDRRAAVDKAQADRLLDELVGIIVPHRGAVVPVHELDEPLLAACKAVGHALDLAIVGPAGREAGGRRYADLVAIARASRVRIRRVLLRAEWWRKSVGPLIAWYGDAQVPVAIIPVTPNRYVMVDPSTGAQTSMDEVSAASLAPAAYALYKPLPAYPLRAVDLLKACFAPGRRDLLRIILAATALGMLAVVPPVITEILIDSVIPTADFGQLANCAAALVAVAIGTAGFQTVQGIALLRLQGSLDWMLQAAVVDRLLRLPAAFFKRYTVGDLSDRALGIEGVRQMLTGRAVGALLGGVFGVFSFALMIHYAPLLALVAGALAIIHGSVILAVAGARLKHERRHSDLQGQARGIVLQLLSAIGKLRVASATSRALAIWALRFSEQKRHFIASQRAVRFMSVFDSGFSTIAALLIFALAAPRASGTGGLETGEFLAFFAAFGQFLASIAGLGIATGESLVAVPLLNRLKPIIAEPLEVSELRQMPDTISGAVELSNVTFRYTDGGPPILDHVSIRANACEYVALVGPSGSGKSTVLRMLLGFERPEAGTVLYDGRALNTLDVSALRRQIGVVTQDGKLISGSIYENICGAVQVPIEQAMEAARLAGMEADIEAMPMGMHTLITEGMSTLSGGQRQRLMIARALVHRPRLLLLDEATSALDNRTQSIVTTGLSTLKVTRIVIAHRLSTVQDADRIIVMAHGQVAQTGTFTELAQRPGIFADLVKRQSL